MASPCPSIRVRGGGAPRIGAARRTVLGNAVPVLTGLRQPRLHDVQHALLQLLKFLPERRGVLGQPALHEHVVREAGPPAKQGDVLHSGERLPGDAGGVASFSTCSLVA